MTAALAWLRECWMKFRLGWETLKLEFTGDEDDSGGN